MQKKFRDDLVQICNDFPELKISLYYEIWETDFLRFFQSQVNYNIHKNVTSVGVSLHKDKKSYSFGLGNPTIFDVRQKIEEAILLIDKLPEDPDFVDIEKDLTIAEPKEDTNNIETVSLERKIEILEELSEAVKPYNFRIFGTFICNYVTSYIVNSNGVNKVSNNSPIMLELKAVHNETMVTILLSFGGENFSSFDVKDFKRNLLLKVEASQKEIIDVDPGEYEVVLAPRCIGEYFSYLVWSMTARMLDQKNSFFEGKIGKKIFPESVTLYDNPHHPDMIKLQYTGDGHIYNPTTLIENGIFKNFIVDNYYSYKTGLEENGCEGESLVMKTGETNLEEMIGSVKKGLYISSLHYMNFINMKETSITGLTRDGTFLIENGKLTKVVNNLRFTEKITDIINGITQIENKSYTIPFSENYDEFSISTVNMPHVKVEGFKISSSTKTI